MKYNFKNWLIKKAGTITMALSHVEKNALTQTGEMMSSDIKQAQRFSQGQVADSLINGEITQEVMDLRWRTYKIIREAEGLSADIIFNKDGTQSVNLKKTNKSRALTKVKVDTFDTYSLEMVLDNSEICIDSSEAMDNSNLNILDKPMINYDDNGEIESATHASIGAEEYQASVKTIRPINIERDERPNFKIETYTKKLYVRKINERKRLLEFYVSIYPDVYNRTSRLFLSDVKKIIKNPRSSSMIDIKSVDFLTHKTLGANDFLKYKYDITSFDKIIEFDGHYVIKFKADIIIDGEDIFLKHKQDELELKYQNKVKK